MKPTIRRTIVTTLIACTPSLGFGQAFTFTAAGLTYTENFDAMGASGATYLPGWEGARVGGSGAIGPLVLIAGNGGGNTGGVYNVGTTGSGERALGSLGSSSTFPAFGASFSNGTGATVTLLNISAFAEQWRSGSSATANETIVFEYSFDATSLTTGSWTSVAALSLNEILTGSTTAAAVDGNANRQSIMTPISVSWNAGATMWIRWRDQDDGGADGLYALDDLTFTVTNGAPPKSIVWNPPGGDWNTVDTNWLEGAVPAAFVTADNVTFDDTGLANGATVTVQAGGIAPGNINVSNTTGSYIFKGGAIGGSGMLTKIGAGTLILQTTYANAISVQAGTLITQGANLLSDIAGLNIESGARVEVDAGGDTVGPVTLTGGHLKANGAVTLNGNVTVNTAATNSRIEGTLALGGSNRTINLVGNPVLDIDASISGNVRLAITGAGRVNLNADSSATYSGNVQINPNVTVSIATAGGLGSAQLFANGGTLTSPMNAAPLLISNAVSFGGDLVFDSARDFEFSGPWTFFNTIIPGTKVLRVNNTTRISGTITGTGDGSAIQVVGSGKLVISGVNDSFKSLTVDGTDGAALEWNGKLSVPPPDPVPVPPTIELLAGARLTGEGLFGPLSVIGGIVAPGTVADPTGVFETAGVFVGLGTLEFDLGGTTPGASDQFIVTGTVSLAGDLVVSLINGFSPALNDVFTIILNDGADPVSNSFAGLPDNTSFTAGGTMFRIDYDGGDGNDVTLTAVPEPVTGAMLLGGLALIARRRRR